MFSLCVALTYALSPTPTHINHTIHHHIITHDTYPSHRYIDPLDATHLPLDGDYDISSHPADSEALSSGSSSGSGSGSGKTSRNNQFEGQAFRHGVRTYGVDIIK